MSCAFNPSQTRLYMYEELASWTRHAIKACKRENQKKRKTKGRHSLPFSVISLPLLSSWSTQIQPHSIISNDNTLSHFSHWHLHQARTFLSLSLKFFFPFITVLFYDFFLVFSFLGFFFRSELVKVFATLQALFLVPFLVKPSLFLFVSREKNDFLFFFINFFRKERKEHKENYCW